MKKINNGMEYNNGVFLILEPGYYRIVAHIKSRDNELDYRIVKNSRDDLIQSKSEPWDVSSTHYIANLKQFDMISIELRGEATVGLAAAANTVQIEKIN